jgi:hypothetical protein
VPVVRFAVLAFHQVRPVLLMAPAHLVRTNSVT